MHVSGIEYVVHSCFELRSALSQSSWIIRYIRVIRIIIIIFSASFALI